MIPMGLDLFHALKVYLKERDRLGRKYPRFLVAVNNDRPLGYRGLQRLVSRLRESTGIYFYSHMPRHTFAALMLEGGADIYAIWFQLLDTLGAQGQVEPEFAAFPQDVSDGVGNEILTLVSKEMNGATLTRCAAQVAIATGFAYLAVVLDA